MRTLNDYFVTAEIEDISTASSTFVGIPDGGRVIKIITALQGAIGTANGGISFEIGGTAITGGGITVTQSGSAALLTASSMKVVLVLTVCLSLDELTARPFMETMPRQHLVVTIPSPSVVRHQVPSSMPTLVTIPFTSLAMSPQAKFR